MDLKELELLIKNHDFTYMMADDMEAYQEGLNEKRIIDKALKELPEAQAIELWNKYAPKMLQITKES
jgi:hypothetical protein